MNHELSNRQFYFGIAAILVLALLAREWFVLSAAFPNPMQGDVSSYVRYALHLIWDSTFSRAEQGQPVVPDAYRGPGYPAFLAMLYLPSDGRHWLMIVHQAQVLLGVATVLVVIATARLWMARPWALLAGAWLALEPHHIAASGTLLTELLLGFLLSIACLGALLTLQCESLRWAIATAVALALAYLVNPAAALLPFLLSVVLWRNGLPRLGLAILLFPLLAISAWSLRNEMQHLDSSRRAAENFVQGSWPEYHQAWKYQRVDNRAHAILSQIEVETDQLVTQPVDGLSTVARRLASNPGRSLLWYAAQKPYLLWDWEIRVGAGGVNFLDTHNSPLDGGTLLGVVSAAQRTLNPLMVALAVIGVIVCVRVRLALPIAMLFVYVTAIHVVFQAEPRYATAYKPTEILLAVSAMAYLSRVFMEWKSRRVRLEIAAHAKIDSPRYGPTP